jgi:6-phosphogluconolactonase
MKANCQIHHFASPEALAAAAAERWLAEVAAAGATGRTWTVALSGGRITTKFFAAIVAQNQVRKVRLEPVHFFWADERCVPPEDAESNFRLASEGLFDPLSIAPPQIHRLAGETDPVVAARAASDELRHWTSADPGSQPVLDLVLLGMGEDGHVASLFPGAAVAVVAEPDPYLVIRQSPKPPPVRLTLSYASLAAARQVWVLASGAGKTAALRESLADGMRTPLGRVLAARTVSELFTDLPLL